MRQAFLDTSYVLALVLRDDEHHETAIQFQQQYRGELVTTDYVLLEVHDSLCQESLRPLALSVTDRLLGDASVTIIRGSDSLFDRGRNLFRSRPDKDWSLTDCISFVIMQDHELREALAFDDHFRQAGFNTLTK